MEIPSAYDNATTVTSGLMSFTDKIKLNNIPEAPNINGAYFLRVDVSSGAITYMWQPLIDADVTGY